jgi:hypothetical protein
MLLMKTHTGYALQMQQTSRDVNHDGDSDGELDAEMSTLSLHRDGSADEQSSDLTLPPPAVYHYHSRDTLDDPSTLARAGITREQAQELTVEVGDVEGDDGRDLEMECAMTFTRPSTGFEDELAPAGRRRLSISMALRRSRPNALLRFWAFPSPQAYIYKAGVQNKNTAQTLLSHKAQKPFGFWEQKQPTAHGPWPISNFGSSCKKN